VKKKALWLSKSSLLVAGGLSLLLVPAPTHAAPTVLTVGPHGTYATIQQAIDVAIVGSDTEILVEHGSTYNENLTIPASFSSGSILLWGGWDSTFTVHWDEAHATVIDGGGSGVLNVLLGGGSFEIRYFTITNGMANQGAGVFILPGGDASVTLNGLIVEENTATTAGAALGGGIWALLSNAQSLDILNCRIHNNQAISTGGGAANGGGLGIVAEDSSRFLIQDTEIEENYLQTSAHGPSGAGVLLELSDTAQGEVLDTFVVGNSSDSDLDHVLGTGGWIGTANSATLRMERTAWAMNEGAGDDTGSQILSAHYGDSSMTIRDSGLVLGDHEGIVTLADDSSVVRLVNLTVADHVSTGLVLFQADSGVVTLYNTIAYNNGTDLSTHGTVGSGFNLIGVDPMFANPSVWDYRLRPGSPAIDVGTNLPPGGLGSGDLDGNPRIQDGTVDLGCYEGPTYDIFSDGFESGDTEEWPITVQ